MKKVMLFALTLLLGWSCQKNQEQLIPANPVPEAVAIDHQVTLNEAIEHASRILFGEETTRSRGREIKNTELFVARPATRSTEGEEISFYLINYEGGGFAMASTDSRTTPIYAYSDKGQLNASDFSENPGLSVYLAEAVIPLFESELENPVAQPASWTDRKPIPTNPILLLATEERDGIIYYVDCEEFNPRYGPYLVTEWHQGDPYNRLLAPDLVGYSPLAAGQIMAYHKHPASYGDVNFDWEAMTASPTFPNEDVSQATYDISWLVWNIGEEAGTNHGTTNSSTNFNRIDDGFEAFGYTTSDPTYPDRDRMIGRLADGYPIWMRGVNSSGIGHAWVVDGYHCRFFINYFYSSTPPYNLCFTESITHPTYYHCNWGWGGSGNGFYVYPELGEYTSGLRCIHDIVPNR